MYHIHMTAYDPDAFTFSNFIRCDATEKAFLAMLGISKQPFCAPFEAVHLYGQPGCGKSRLLKTLALSLSQQGIRFHYVEADEVMTHYRSASILNAVSDFKKYYAYALDDDPPILLIDNFDCVSGKRVMPEMFEELLLWCPQYVLASNMPWHEIVGFEKIKPLSVAMGPPSEEALARYARLVFDFLLTSHGNNYQSRPSNKSIELFVKMAGHDFRLMEGLIKNICAGVHFFAGDRFDDDDAIVMALESRVGPLRI